MATVGYLEAFGRPGLVAWATGAFGVVWIAVTAPLLDVVGVTAIGVGNLCGALVEVVLLTRATARSAGVVPYRPLLLPLLVAVISGCLGWVVCAMGPPALWTAVGAGLLTTSLAVAGLLLVCPRDLKEVLGLATETVQSILPGRRKPSRGADEAPSDISSSSPVLAK